VIDNKRVVAIVPARGGSKGIPRKNIRLIAGKPLLAYTIEAAIACEEIDLLVVSSDDKKILQVAERCGATPLQRPAELARDESSSIEAVFHALTEFDAYDVAILLQPTSPLRTADDISAALLALCNAKAPACISISAAATSPYRAFHLLPDCRLQRFVDKGDVPIRRQDTPIFYAANGAIYIAEIPWLIQKRQFLTEETIGYVMPPIRSLDIDTEFDLALCDFLIRKYSLPPMEALKNSHDYRT